MDWEPFYAEPFLHTRVGARTHSHSWHTVLSKAMQLLQLHCTLLYTSYSILILIISSLEIVIQVKWWQIITTCLCKHLLGIRIMPPNTSSLMTRVAYDCKSPELFHNSSMWFFCVTLFYSYQHSATTQTFLISTKSMHNRWFKSMSSLDSPSFLQMFNRWDNSLEFCSCD